ncbi:proton-conducting transporter membrane subunit [Sphingobium estronivorans]|uniref:proton-conducting transporter transmembrane domain-containing protein n=1 Tax=Sphingobium estronivorans TaxID=1577690 RepID=UPI00123C7291|nr:proton-conducting transporter membrane subunit [Sphingobium estronivorans]
MANELIAAAALLWIAGGVLALIGLRPLARAALALGALAGVATAIVALPEGTGLVPLPTRLAGDSIDFQLTPSALWLMGFGLAPAALAVAICTPMRAHEGSWLFGAAMSLLGAIGVFGIQDGAGLIVAWELMSLGGGVMLMSESLGHRSGRSILFMLGLLEIGTVAMMLGVILLGQASGHLAFAGFGAASSAMGPAMQTFIWLLLLVAFGAKLGLLPFYEWFPRAYGTGSGATGALMSGVVLNAAYFALARALTEWIPAGAGGLGIVVVLVGVASAILAALYAFQEDDWRRLLSFSSAENAALAVVTLGASIMFTADGNARLAGLAWTVSLLHLGGHALAKGCLFLTADGVRASTGNYHVRQNGVLRSAGWPLGLGALIAAGSLSAMPPTAGFVSEWYLFQTVFQGFHLATLGARLTLAIAGAGLALTAAVALATFVKLFGIGLLGARPASMPGTRVPGRTNGAVLLLGLGVLVLAIGMPWWIMALDDGVEAHFAPGVIGSMVVGWVLVPATGGPIGPDHSFAFISPTTLAIAMPLLAILPLLLLYVSSRFRVRRSAVWYGGLRPDPARAATTALSFSNAMRTFYSLIYRPQDSTQRETNGQPYFVRRLTYRHAVAPLFAKRLFGPLVMGTVGIASAARRLQSGSLNLYLALIGALLVIILALSLL